MAPSQIEHQQERTLGQGYTHKKFNYGYSHKKLGLRAKQREQDNKENITQQQTEQVKTTNSFKGLFRPYALDEYNTPRKRKIARSSEDLEDKIVKIISTPQASPIAYNMQNYQQQQLTSLNVDTTTTAVASQTLESHTLSPTLCNTSLQEQRAAFYMRYMAQIQQQNTPPSLQTATGYPMGYPNVTAPICNDS